MVESGRHGLSLVESMIVPFVLGRRHVADRLEQPPIVEPVDPFQRRVLHGIEGAPRTARVDHLGLVEPDDRLGQRVVVGVPDAADRSLDAGLGQPLGVADRQVLARRGRCGGSAPRLAWRACSACSSASSARSRAQRARHPPADDAAREDVDDERHVDEPRPGRHVGQVRHPQLVRPRRRELALHADRPAGRRGLAGIVVRQRRPRTTPARPIWRISRSTVQRATRMPSRRSCRHTLRAP